MSTYNSIIKKRNAGNTDWDTILPVTTAENVMLDSETNLDDKLSELETTVIPSKALYKNGSGTFTAGGTTYQVTDAFITANTMVIVSPTSAKLGMWSVSSGVGNFTITSDATETNAVTFDWGAVK